MSTPINGNGSPVTANIWSVGGALLVTLVGWLCFQNIEHIKELAELRKDQKWTTRDVESIESRLRVMESSVKAKGP